MRNFKPVVWLISLFAGAIGLIYQVIWIRQLTLIFGSTALPASTVLIALLCGLAVGSIYFGRTADREERPLRLFAVLETGVGVYILVSPLLLNVLNAVHILAYRGLNGEFYSLLFIRFALSFLFLFVPSVLMGGALPILCKVLAGSTEKLGFPRRHTRRFEVDWQRGRISHSGIFLDANFGDAAVSLLMCRHESGCRSSCLRPASAIGK